MASGEFAEAVAVVERNAQLLAPLISHRFALERGARGDPVRDREPDRRDEGRDRRRVRPPGPSAGDVRPAVRQPSAYSSRAVDGVGHGADDRPDLELLVRLHGRSCACRRPARPRRRCTSVPISTPGRRRERQRALLVVAVAAEHREADDRCRRRRSRRRKSTSRSSRSARRRTCSSRRPVSNSEAKIFATSSAFQASVTFLRCASAIDLLERLAADEVVVELHERPVAELPRVQVVVLDVVRHEAAGERAGGLVAVGGRATRGTSQLLAGVDRRQRGRDPAGLQRVGRRRRGSRTGSRPNSWPASRIASRTFS